MTPVRPNFFLSISAFVAVLAGFCMVAAPARAEESVLTTVCRLIENSARAEKLPVAFLTKLIWRESAFRADAVSPKGAQGIAQFMPGTANERGLADPFDPEEAIPHAAKLLRDLRAHFGNLGLAAAAYNAGAARVDAFVGGHGGLPLETRDYVLAITGAAAEDWRAGASAPAQPENAQDSCEKITVALKRSRGTLIASLAPTAPWGVQLSGNFSKAIALASFQRAKTRLASVLQQVTPMIIGSRLRSRGARPFYRVRAPARSRGEAQGLCDRIHKAGGACVVLRS
ncbi:MAG: lytic transglycosylase domain-containing protein [Hyphomicrobiales bacterium]|nr:lytic transglycosylase domain-containing protein [Hyphomicrobiales bacterium]